MEPISNPQKKSNIPIIAAVSVVFACCCGTVILCLIAGAGFFALNRTSYSLDSHQTTPTESFDNMFPPTSEPFDPNIPQGGRGDNALRKRVWDFIVPMAEEQAGCVSPLAIISVLTVTSEPDSAGVWEETWEVFCENGSNPVFRIIFTPNSDGTINFSPGLINK